MKRCPTCQRTYGDDQVFCTDDGATLTSDTAQNDPAATAVYSGAQGSVPPPTQSYGSNAAPGYQPPPPSPGMFPPPGGPQAENVTNKFQPALIGGVVLGLLSAIPYIKLGNCVCCLWVLLGGALATYLYIKKSPTAVQIGEGTMVGLLAGVIGSVINIIVGIPLEVLAGNPTTRMMLGFMERMESKEMAEAIRQIEATISRPTSEQLLDVFSLNTLIGFIVVTGLATLGGLIAVPIFEKRKAQQAPPPLPPPDFSGGYR